MYTFRFVPKKEVSNDKTRHSAGIFFSLVNISPERILIVRKSKKKVISAWLNCLLVMKEYSR